MTVSVTLVWLTLTNEQILDKRRSAAVTEASAKIKEFIDLGETDGKKSVEKNPKYFTTKIVYNFKTMDSATKFAEYMNEYAIKYGYTLVSASIE